MRLFERLVLVVLLFAVWLGLITCGAYHIVKVITEVEKGSLNFEELDQ